MINSFSGKYEFLSNFFELPVTVAGVCYRNSEAAYQSFKVMDECERLKFADLPANKAKKLGRKVELRKDWEYIKDSVMLFVVKCKFNQNPEYIEKLLETGDEELVEGNDWGDTYWGVCNGKGINKLGEILMILRDAYKLDRMVR